MAQNAVIQVYIGPEDYGCPVRFDQLFTDDVVANKCVEMLRQLYPAADIYMNTVQIHSEVPRYYHFMASVPFATPAEVQISSVAPTLCGRPFQDVFELKARHIACANGWGATEAEAVEAAYSLYEIACARGLVESFRERMRLRAQRDEQIWVRARALGKVTRNPYTREEEIDPGTHASLYDIISKELSLD